LELAIARFGCCQFSADGFKLLCQCIVLLRELNLPLALLVIQLSELAQVLAQSLHFLLPGTDFRLDLLELRFGLLCEFRLEFDGGLKLGKLSQRALLLRCCCGGEHTLLFCLCQGFLGHLVPGFCLRCRPLGRSSLRRTPLYLGPQLIVLGPRCRDHTRGIGPFRLCRCALVAHPIVQVLQELV